MEVLLGGMACGRGEGIVPIPLLCYQRRWWTDATSNKSYKYDQRPWGEERKYKTCLPTSSLVKWNAKDVGQQVANVWRAHIWRRVGYKYGMGACMSEGVPLDTQNSCHMVGQGGCSASLDCSPAPGMRYRREGLKVKYPCLSPWFLGTSGPEMPCVPLGTETEEVSAWLQTQPMLQGCTELSGASLTNRSF